MRGSVDQQVINPARGTTEYESGNTIRLSATPNSDFLFYDWQQIINNSAENSFEDPFEFEMEVLISSAENLIVFLCKMIELGSQLLN